MSAFEHCARAMSSIEFTSLSSSVYNDNYYASQHGWCGNFRGFIQYRKMFPNENRTDLRLIKK